MKLAVTVFMHYYYIIIFEVGMRCKPLLGVTPPPKVLKVDLYIYALFIYIYILHTYNIRRSIRTTAAAAGRCYIIA